MAVISKRIALFLAMLLVVLSAAGALAAEKLVIYSSVDEENVRNILDQFSRATGVEYQMVSLSSEPALSRIEAEKGNPQADIWFGAPNENHIVAKERGLTQAYSPAAAKDLAANFCDADGFWHAFYMNPVAFGVLPRRPCRGQVLVAGQALAVPRLKKGTGSEEVVLSVRPEALSIAPASETATGSGFRGNLTRTTFLGNLVEYKVSVEGLPNLVVHSPNPLEGNILSPGSEVDITLLPSTLHPLTE